MLGVNPGHEQYARVWASPQISDRKLGAGSLIAWVGLGEKLERREYTGGQTVCHILEDVNASQRFLKEPLMLPV